MRITGGKYRGRVLRIPVNLNGRPTTDFAREALFDILSNRIDFENVEVLDLFSGTGSISFEFASRGAKAVHLVEFNRNNINIIRQNIRHFNINIIKPVRLDVRDFLKICSYRYDIVFADPPYDLTWLGEIPGMVFSSGILKKGGLLVIEHPGRIKFEDKPFFIEHRRYGKVNFSFFRESNAQTDAHH